MTQTEITVPTGILQFLTEHQAYLTEREGVDSPNALLQKLVAEGFDAMIDSWHLKPEEIHSKYGIQEP